METDPVREQRHVTFDAAEAAARAGLAKAAEIGVRVGICVTDAHGDVVMFARMDGAPGRSDQAARGKAAFAAGLGLSTGDFIEKRLRNDEVLWRAMSSNPDIFIVPGGFPLLFHGTSVGGVGVSGAAHEQDSIVAEAAADHFAASVGADE